MSATFAADHIVVVSLKTAVDVYLVGCDGWLGPRYVFKQEGSSYFVLRGLVILWP